MKVKIDRSRWTTGSLCMMRRGQPCFCIVGHIAHACGIGDGSLRSRSSLSRLPKELWEKLPEPLRPLGDTAADGEPSRLECKLINLNDESQLPTDEIEAEMQRLALEAGIELEFLGERCDYNPNADRSDFE
jgi:hypothetical protein